MFILCVQCRPFMQRVICAEFELLKSANGAKSSRPKKDSFLDLQFLMLHFTFHGITKLFPA